jgi:hypothetical protein
LPSDQADFKEATMGLLRTAATVAVASSVHGRVQRRQQDRWGRQEAASVPPPAQPVSPPAVAQPQSASTDDRLAQLKQLGDLLSAGVLTQSEFEQQKARILNG